MMWYMHSDQSHHSLACLLCIVIVVRIGKFAERDLADWSGRDFKERGFTVGIGGYVSPNLSFYLLRASDAFSNAEADL